MRKVVQPEEPRHQLVCGKLRWLVQRSLKRAIQEICNRKPPGSEIRVWTAGCASGEEAYSIAMLFAEALGEKLPQYHLQIFATDIDDDALNVARYC